MQSNLLLIPHMYVDYVLGWMTFSPANIAFIQSRGAHHFLPPYFLCVGNY